MSTRLLTVQAADAHRVATRREDYTRQRVNAALSEFDADLRAAARWYADVLHTRSHASFQTVGQRRADRKWHALLVAAANNKALEVLR